MFIGIQYPSIFSIRSFSGSNPLWLPVSGDLPVPLEVFHTRDALSAYNNGWCSGGTCVLETSMMPITYHDCPSHAAVVTQEEGVGVVNKRVLV